MDAPAPAPITAPPIPAWYSQAFAWIGAHVGIAEVVLIGLLFGGAWIVWQAQKRDNFDWADMLKDDTSGKVTPLRLAIVGSFAISSWAIMHDVLDKNLSDAQWTTYLVTWSGAAIMRIFAEKWDGRLPGARGDGSVGRETRPG